MTRIPPQGRDVIFIINAVNTNNSTFMELKIYDPAKKKSKPNEVLFRNHLLACKTTLGTHIGAAALKVRQDS